MGVIWRCEKINDMLETDIFEMSSQTDLGVLSGTSKGLWVSKKTPNWEKSRYG